MARKHQLDGKIITLRKGLAIYKTHASPYWNVRIRDYSTGRYVVRSTKCKSRIEAQRAADELMITGEATSQVKREFTFDFFADRFIKSAIESADKGIRNANYVRTAVLCVNSAKWGLLKEFKGQNIQEINTRGFKRYVSKLTDKPNNLSKSTIGTITATFRNVMKEALDEGVIDVVPATPRLAKKDNPRAFFRFSPLVDSKHDDYKLLLDTAKKLRGEMVRGVAITDELYDLILFTTHSFVRPTVSELYALKHEDVSVRKDPKRLLLNIRKGKTGARIANTMPAAVSVYERVLERHPDHNRDDYLFFPGYQNRDTAKRIVMRQFNQVLDVAGIKQDIYTDAPHTVYSLRHTAICMRLVNSKGKVNIYTLAKNAGTSVQQIERFYARNLPLSAELVENLQSFGE